MPAIPFSHSMVKPGQGQCSEKCLFLSLLGFASHQYNLWASLWLLLLYSGKEAESGPWSKNECYQTKWDLLGDLKMDIIRLNGIYWVIEALL